ncbi:type II toxin-antitoxin system Phd/YefM family antitoxin [Aliiglaciecola litoralis]|uniref:Type II toxin-antitoxin system prevent-host-death family antitoxin n=1 Tax=Aliiglaciecola litoralis TaxID=582857 RepID=A0ABN1LJH2_9ALTE
MHPQQTCDKSLFRLNLVHYIIREKPMRIETISYIKKNASNLPVEEPIIVTQNGAPAYVIEDYAQRKFRDDAIAILKLASFAENDLNKGNAISSDDMKTNLINRLKDSEVK